MMSQSVSLLAKPLDGGLEDAVTSANYHKEALKFTLSHLGTLSEAKRIEAERQFMKEMEAERERKAAEEARMRQRNEQLIACAKRIQHCFRFFQRRKLARAYLHQERLEQCHRQAKRMHASATRIQAVVRGMIVRQWLRSENITLQRECEHKHKLFDRCQLDVNLRRKAKRVLQFDAMFDAYAGVLQHIFTNTDYWAGELKQLEKKHQNAQAKASQAVQEVQKLEVEAARNRDDQGNSETDPYLEKARIKQRYLQEIVDIYLGDLWWVKQQLRQLSRRLAVVVAEFEDALKRMEWSTQEARITERLREGIELRIRFYREKDEDLFEGCIEWLERQHARAVLHLIALDEQQEGMLVGETDMFRRFAASTLRIGGAVNDLMRASSQVVQYLYECTGIEQELALIDEISDRGVALRNRLVETKVRINQLQDGVLDRMRVGVDQMIQEENDSLAESFTILDEITQVTLDNLRDIVARPKRPFHPSQPFQLKDWYNLFMLQPWIHEETVEDLQAEELAMLQRLEADRIQHDVDFINREASETEQQLQLLAKEIAALQEQAYNTTSATLAQQLQEPLMEKEREFKVLEIEELKHKAQLEELMPKLEELVNSSDTIMKVVQARQARRDETIAKFFDLEQDVCKAWTKLLALALHDANALAKQSEVWLGELEIINDGDLKDLAESQALTTNIVVKHQRLLRLSPYLPLIAEHNSLAKQSPMFQANGYNFLRIHLAVLKSRIQADFHCADKFIGIVNSEEQVALTVERRKRKGLEQLREVQKRLRQRRRLNAVQMQITERLKRVDALREAREQDAKRQEEERIAREEAARIKKQAEEEIRKKIQAEEARALEAMTHTGIQRRIRKLKNAVNKVKHAYQRLVEQEPPFTREEEIMARIIGTRMKSKAGAVQGISNIAITVGDEETRRWQEEQEALQKNRLPHFEKLDKSIGIGQPVYIWVQRSHTSEFMITHIELSHTNPGHPFYKDLMRKKFQQVTHDSFSDTTQTEPSLVLWVRRDKKVSKVLGDIKITYTSKEEAELLVADYVKCPESLEVFGFADIGIWYKTVPKSQRVDEVASLIRELQAVREHRKMRPDDQGLRANEMELIQSIEQHREKLQQSVIEFGSNPLQYAVEFLALDEGEIDAWGKIFSRIDKQRDGFITVDDLVRHVRLPLHKFIREAFETVDAIDGNGHIEFGDFVKAVGTFCMFGIDEMLRFIFNLADDDMSGTVTYQEFLGAVNILHPYNFPHMKRQLEQLELNERKGVSFELFMEIHQRLPTLLFPAFQLQNAFRAKFMGTQWWFHKLSSYKNVADRLEKARREEELKQQRAQARMLRRHFDSTEEELKSTKSRLRRALIIARSAFLNDDHEER